MKRLSIITFILITIIFCVSCSSRNKMEIYLVSKDSKITEASLNELVLEEEPILTSDDIVSFYWNKQTFITSKDLLLQRLNEYLDLSEYPIVNMESKIPFVLTIGSKRIYLGEFASQNSSCFTTVDGIKVPQILVEGVMQPKASLLYNTDKNQTAYWICCNDESTMDVLFNSAIKKALKGKLK